MAKAFGMTAETIRQGHGGLARMVTAWLGWWEGLAKLRSIAASLRLNSCGRVSDLVTEELASLASLGSGLLSSLH
ncbi:MAG TPA: hypothetical protein VHL58_16275 [Thermoanaerobaculia bacterium]|nr:hypothetical protein [Thermoanaerobaculia bacterium]